MIEKVRNWIWYFRFELGVVAIAILFTGGWTLLYHDHERSKNIAKDQGTVSQTEYTGRAIDFESLPPGHYFVKEILPDLDDTPGKANFAIVNLAEHSEDMIAPGQRRIGHHKTADWPYLFIVNVPNEHYRRTACFTRTP